MHGVWRGRQYSNRITQEFPIGSLATPRGNSSIRLERPTTNQRRAIWLIQALQLHTIATSQILKLAEGLLRPREGLAIAKGLVDDFERASACLAHEYGADDDSKQRSATEEEVGSKGRVSEENRCCEGDDPVDDPIGALA